MATSGSPDLLNCYYCQNEATKVIDVRKGAEMSRRWVCSRHSERRPKRRSWRTRVLSLR